MKSTQHIFGIMLLCLLTSMMSCKKWLDVQPEDKFTEKQIFSTPAGIAEALNGIYLDMGKSKLYGANLSSTTLDILAQRYNVASLHKQTAYQTYAYEDKTVKANLDNIWTSLYVNVINANKFVQNLDQYPGVLDAETASLFRGEAYALRAFLQFDLLRLFGPVYNTADSVKPAIPYYSSAGTAVNDILPANIVMSHIAADLKTAERLLQNDPIRTQGVIKTIIPGKNHLSYRNNRLNYYAVKGLQARMFLYRGDKLSASAAAKEVINNTAKFPWVTSAILSEKANPDRAFSSEVLFGLQSLDLYDNYRDCFTADLEDRTILAPLDTRLKTTFESNENDYRYNPNWIQTGIGGKSYRTLFKLADVNDKTKDFRFFISLIRLSEVYYIAAECDQSLSYLNTVRNNRGLLNLPANANLTTELQKEYQKEFFGEGQLWYYYKRRNLTAIPNPLSSSGNVTMNALKYVWPLPLSETTPR